MPRSLAEATFHSFEAFEKLVQAARDTNATAHLIVLLGGEAGMRCGEMMALEWKDIDLTKGRLCVARSEWKGHVMAQGAPSRAIQELAGHRNLGTTQRYMHLSPAALEAAIRLLERGEPRSRGANGEAAGTSG